MLKRIAVVVVVLVVAVLGFAATRPDTFEVKRTIRIKAPPDRIYSFVNAFHRWGAWSPYEKRDPDMKRIYSGATDGKGAVYEWDGDSEVGKGRMEITDAAPPSRVTIKLDLAKPMEAHNTAEFMLAPEDGATDVTWSVRGPTPFVAKVMRLFLNVDSAVGKDFEAGLANLKTLAEAPRSDATAAAPRSDPTAGAPPRAEAAEVRPPRAEAAEVRATRTEAANVRPARPAAAGGPPRHPAAPKNQPAAAPKDRRHR